MKDFVSRTAKISIIGRGIAGLSIAVALGRQGFRDVTIIGPPAVPGSASQAAVGVVTLKGWNEPRRPLFVAKYLGHKTLPTWLQSLTAASGYSIRQSWGHVYEPFAALEDYLWIRQRVYHRDFTGGLAVSVTSDPPLPASWGYRGAFHYWQDGWVDVADLLAALHATATTYGFKYIEKVVTDIRPQADGLAVKGKDGILATAEEVILSAGIFCDEIAQKSGLQFPPQTAVGGWTVCGEHASPGEFAMITGKKTLLQGHGLFRFGSTSETAGIIRADVGYHDLRGADHAMYLLDIIDKKGYNTGACQALFGVRARSSDRQPLVGALNFGLARRVWLATGFYKSGVQLGHLIAENLVSQLLGTPVSPLFRNFLPGRFF